MLLIAARELFSAASLFISGRGKGFALPVFAVRAFRVAPREGKRPKFCLNLEGTRLLDGRLEVGDFGLFEGRAPACLPSEPGRRESPMEVNLTAGTREAGG